jgi:hypothetical protein
MENWSASEWRRLFTELKVRLTEITAKAGELRDEIVALEGQKTAFETVIRSYGPTYLSRSSACKTHFCHARCR